MTNSKNRTIFFGSSPFAIPALKQLAADSDYKIAAVVTQPDKPAGRRQALLPSPVKVEAEELGLKVLQSPNLQPTTYNLPADLFIVASYGQIIPESILKIPKYGALNIHPSLLPKYRGPSPIQAAILNGDTETGVTIIKLDEEVDHGDIVANSKVKIQNSKVTYQELHEQLSALGADLLMQTLPDYLSGKIKPAVQDHAQAVFTKLITKDDARIDWTESAEQIDRMIRAYHLWPVAWTTLDGKRLKIFEATPHPTSLPVRQAGPTRGGGINPKNFPPPGGEGLREGGLVVSLHKLFVQCGSGILELKALQLEGAKKITAREFANGYRNLLTKPLL